MRKSRSVPLAVGAVQQLRRLGLDDEAMGDLQGVCTVIRTQGWFSVKPPTKASLEDRLALVDRLAAELGVALQEMPGALEPELYEQGIEVHELRGQLAGLRAAARRIRGSLASYKATGQAPVLPVVLIARAVQRCIRVSATRGGAFYRVVEICYRSIGASEEQLPSVRTLRSGMQALSRQGTLQD